MKSINRKFPKNIPKNITFKDQFCPHCKTENIFSKSKSVLFKHCVKCEDITLTETTKKVEELQNQAKLLTPGELY